MKKILECKQGGSANYEKLDFDGTQKIIFDFEIIDEVDKDKIKKVVYRMILTINQHQIIRAGNISLLHYLNDEYDDNELNFSFDFQQSAFDDENLNPLGNFKIENYVYQNKVKYSYDYLEGLIYINDFLKQFFSNALIPMFINRGAFIEASYLNFLTYDTVIVNFLGLKPDNFLSVVKLYNVSNNKIQQEQKDEIDFKLQGKNILNSSFKIMNDFYKNYLRTIFDLENNTYTQGYNKKYGLLANNGFKIYPRYFYFSDKYKKLDFKMYSAYKNRFYNTNYGDVFNYDFSVANNYNINQNEGYVFERTLKDKYGLKYKKMEEQKIGYNVFELQAQKENDIYRYYDFNFGIYNGQEINNGGLFPDSQGGQAQYESCSGYNLACHIRNAAIGIVNNIPGIKQVNELASGVGKIFQTIYSFFNQTFEVGKFSPALYSIITNLFLLIIFMKFVRLI